MGNFWEKLGYFLFQHLVTRIAGDKIRTENLQFRKLRPTTLPTFQRSLWSCQQKFSFLLKLLLQSSLYLPLSNILSLSISFALFVISFFLSSRPISLTLSNFKTKISISLYLSSPPIYLFPQPLFLSLSYFNIYISLSISFFLQHLSIFISRSHSLLSISSQHIHLFLSSFLSFFLSFFLQYLSLSTISFYVSLIFEPNLG